MKREPDAAQAGGTSAAGDEVVARLLRCLKCGSPLLAAGGVPPVSAEHADGELTCPSCQANYPIRSGTVVMLDDAAQGEGAPSAQLQSELSIKRKTAESFAYEWEQFGELREEWAQNFAEYLRPHTAEFLRGKLVLDVGAGSGRHSHQAHTHGARVVAADLGAAIHVARRNLPAEVLTVQADAEHLPLPEAAFDFVISIGVLHHMPDTRRALHAIVRHVKPGGYVQIYVNCEPEQRWQRSALSALAVLRRVTTRMPYRLLHLLSYPGAAVLFVLFALPYRAMRPHRSLRAIAERLPLRSYADYPFGVCVNDLFDRMVAPIVHRFTEQQMRELMLGTGLTDVVLTAHHGWIASARRPENSPPAAPAFNQSS
ncbi:MAG: methyltransferase domain-containing protein [Solirubrobacteraceae bacterium]